MKGLLFVVGLCVILALFGLGGDDSDQALPPVAVHNSAHDCSQGMAEMFMFGAASLIFGNAQKVIATDGVHVMVCQDLDGDGVCEPRTLFTCRNAPVYVQRDAARNGLAPLSQEDVRNVLHWPSVDLAIWGMAAACGLLLLGLLMQPRRTA